MLCDPLYFMPVNVISNGKMYVNIDPGVQLRLALVAAQPFVLVLLRAEACHLNQLADSRPTSQSTFIVVALELEELLEVWLAEHFAFQGGKSTQAHRLLAHLAAEAFLVVGVAIRLQLLHQEDLLTPINKM